MTDTTTSRNPEQTRERILDAALDVFAEKGYHDAKMDEIVEESNTSKGSIYFHFPNKERLFLALVDQFADVLERQVTQAIRKEDEGMKRVQIALETVVATFGQYRRPAKVMLVQAMGLGAPFEQKQMQIKERFAILIGKYLEEAVEQGEIEPLDTDVIAYAWMGAIYSVVIRWVYTGEPAPERIVDGIVPALLRSVGYTE